jgi:hypothetical protein
MQSGFTEPGTARPWPAERIEYWAIEQLTPYADNAPLHSEADMDKLVGSLRRWGWTNPVLVDEHGVLIAGHGRVRAAAKLGLASIPVMVARSWSEEEKRRPAQNLGRPARQKSAVSLPPIDSMATSGCVAVDILPQLLPGWR